MYNRTPSTQIIIFLLLAGKKEKKGELTPNRRIRRSRVSSSRTVLVPCRCTWETCSGDGRTRTPPRHRAIRPSTRPIDWCSSSATRRNMPRSSYARYIEGIDINLTQLVFSAIRLDKSDWTRIENFPFSPIRHHFANFSSLYIYINLFILQLIRYFPLFNDLYSFKLSFRFVD